MAFNLMNPKITLQGTTIENYTDDLALAFKAVKIRSSKDTSYVQYQGLFGHLLADKLSSTDTSLPPSSSVNVKDVLKSNGTDSTELIKIGSLNALDNDSGTLNKAYKALMLHKYNCVATVYDGNIKDITKLHTESLLFWLRYRAVNKHLYSLSKEFLTNNRKFVQPSSNLGAGSGLSKPDADGGVFSVGSSSNCLFTEGSALSIKFLSVPVNNGLPKLLTVSFGFTCCEIYSAG